MLWSWILMVWGVTGLYLAGNGKRAGWAVNITAQLAWVAYALATKQYGFLISAGAYSWVYIRNYRKWKAADAR